MNNKHQIERAATTEGLPIAVSMGPALDAAAVPTQSTLVDKRVVLISVLSILVAIASAFIAQILMHLIWLITNISFHHTFSFEYGTPPQTRDQVHAWMIFVPVIGGVIVGFMARYGHKAIRGHGIPEAMEQVLLNESRIPPRITFLKPLSAAIAIGTGGPFGAEGPIIATGGALGSLVGQIISTSASERKTLLAAGAAAGMAATFGSPVSAVLLAVELLLFEFRPRSIIPVALAAATAAGVRVLFDGVKPVFLMPDLVTPAGAALGLYILLGAVIGVISVYVTRAVYFVEDSFEHLPIHWMWWPAIGAVAVGICGYFAPRTLGVGYYNISDILSGTNAWSFLLFLVVMKFISWAISLGSGTSGGTLAPLFTIGGGLGALLGIAVQHLFPHVGMDVRIAALVGMAAIFAGASRAMLASVIFAFETTLQPLGLLPLLGGCTASFLMSCLLMRNTIMTEKIARRGVRVPAEYHADFLDQVLVRDVATKEVIALHSDQTLDEIRAWIGTGFNGTKHQGFPILDSQTHLLIGVLTRRDLLSSPKPGPTKLQDLIHQFPRIIYDDLTLRDAADHMVNHDIGRLPVVTRAEPGKVIGMITRSDVLGAHRVRLSATRGARSNFHVPKVPAA
ncbi:MAG TPA: chloride channel protein [Tepidisphaeraceae bacterium]|nr:chloride channel protein [Tepidisphaeraceae bacterium]